MSEHFQPGTVKPESDYEELERLGTKLGIPIPLMHIELVSRDRNGDMTGHYKDRSRTWNRNYWNFLFASMGAFANDANSSMLSSDSTFGAGHLAIKRTNGTVTNANAAGGVMVAPTAVFKSTAADATTGIVVGTGTAAESFEDVALGTQCAEGTGTNQFNHQTGSFSQPSYNAGSKVWTAAESRVFNNNSSGTIVVGETGLYATNNSLKYMICRDRLGATVSVLAAGQLTVTYTVTLTFPN